MQIHLEFEAKVSDFDSEKQICIATLCKNLNRSLINFLATNRQICYGVKGQIFVKCGNFDITTSV